MKHNYTDEIHNKALADQLKNRTQLKGYGEIMIQPLPTPQPSRTIHERGLFHNIIKLIKKILKK